MNQSTLKRCSTCGETKPVAEFHRSRSRKDGLGCQCKPCKIAAVRAYQKANPEKRRASQRAYHASSVGKTRRRAYLEANADHIRERQNAYQATPAGRARDARARAKKPLAVKRAHRAVRNEVEAGRLKPAREQLCTCGRQAQELHHPDYDRPLYVVALCVVCHKATHRALVAVDVAS
jgi:hypothetical protein